MVSKYMGKNIDGAIGTAKAFQNAHSYGTVGLLSGGEQAKHLVGYSAQKEGERYSSTPSGPVRCSEKKLDAMVGVADLFQTAIEYGEEGIKTADKEQFDSMELSIIDARRVAREGGLELDEKKVRNVFGKYRESARIMEAIGFEALRNLSDEKQ